MKKFGPLTALAAVLAILLAVNLTASLTLDSVDLDLTEEKLYTLSDGSAKIASSLENGVKIKLFYSRSAASDVPRLRQYAGRVEGLLEQFEAASGGNVSFEAIEPLPDTEEEEWALSYGLQGASKRDSEPLYFGLVAINEVGREEVMPFLSTERESYLEFDLARMLVSLGGTKKKTVGILSPLGVMGSAPNPMHQMGGGQPSWSLVDELEKSFDVKSIPTDTKKIEGVDLLLVIYPENLSEPTLYAIDQYIVGGGNALVAVDPMGYAAVNPATMQMGMGGMGADMPKLLKAWGLTMPAGKVVVDDALATEIYMRNRPMRHPAFLTLGPEQCNQDEIVSANLEELLMAYPGYLLAEDELPDGLEKTTLLTTSERVGTVFGQLLQMSPDPRAALRQLEPEEGPLDLMVKLTGEFISAFPDGPPEEAEAPADGHKAKGEVSGAVIVTSDADWLTDDLSVRRQRFFGQTLSMLLNDNLVLMGNAAEILGGGEALASLRTRGKSNRPFTLVRQLEAEAAQRWQGVEEELLVKQEETNRRLAELERGKEQSTSGEGVAALSRSQIEEIRSFREELADNKRKLREVRRNLRQEIESLGTWVKSINIGLVPLLVVLAGFVPVWMRNRKTTQASGSAKGGAADD